VPDPESRRAGGRCLFLRFLIAPGHLCAGRVTSPVRPEAGELLLSRAGKLTVFTGVFVRREPEVTDGLPRLVGCVQPAGKGAGQASLSADTGIQQPPGKGGGL
jgi:hypothetical protein